MKIDRVELADCGSPERLIAEILRQHPEIPIPVPIEAIASAVGILDIHRLETQGFEGGLITQPERRDGVILVSAVATAQRQRFTIAHELGHYLIASHKPQKPEGFFCTTADLAIRVADRDNHSRRMEAQANRFGAGILMPLPKFKANMREMGAPDLTHVFSLAARYETSREATALHYVTYHDVACAVVIGQAGVVRRVLKPLTFPQLCVAPNQPFPAGSLGARRLTGKRNDWAELDADVWLANEACLGRRLTEQLTCVGSDWTWTLLIDELLNDGLDEVDDGLSGSRDVWAVPVFTKSRRS